MKPKVSELVLVDFVIINSNFKFIMPTNEENFDFQKQVADYSLDMDFSIVRRPGNPRVFIKAAINYEKNLLPGYSIFAEGVAIYNLSDSADIDSKKAAGLLQFSGVSIAINSLRFYIALITSCGPLGKFLLPSIDINDLIQQKGNAIAQKVKKSNKGKRLGKK